MEFVRHSCLWPIMHRTRIKCASLESSFTSAWVPDIRVEEHRSEDVINNVFLLILLFVLLHRFKIIIIIVFKNQNM